jgi:hypothetical protein
MIFTLCGSAKFEKVWHEANKQLGLAGHIAFSLMTFPSVEGSKSWYTEAKKTILDLAHLAKIEASDAVLMLNVNQYLGESSLRELEWARMRTKEIFWLELDSRRSIYDCNINQILSIQALEILDALCRIYKEDL